MGIFLFYLWHAIRTGKKTHATAKRKERQKRWLRVPVLQFDSLLYESVCLAVELTVGKDVASQSSSLLLKGFNLQDWKIGRDISCNLREEVSRQQERNQRDTFFFVTSSYRSRMERESAGRNKEIWLKNEREKWDFIIC